MRREIVSAIRCPLGDYILLEDCRKCPYHDSRYKLKNEVECLYETPSEKKMKPEQAKVKEPKSKW